ncbi:MULTISPECIES: glycosyltransferase [Morganellaceae]|uniref:Glycosyltransferase n=2 Tax=Providencia TaxID=586 RepID=A0A1B7JXQ5_9GAMM|nr:MULTISPECIES: glycosyltransferase [Providencia]OAT52668.1 glycosyltransferase [Providencia heimbachae ATCC 35613]OZS73826.1 amylovoran biosynthesis protein AmsE [Providencia rettgeri]SQH14821.1 putative glycosyl transferase [Providencia heimbachae]
MIKFTVLLSVYKNESAEYLNDAFNSILIYQTVLPNEVILIKDGRLSSELDDLIYHWSKQYPKIMKVIELKENVGLGKALNEGLKYCSYNWVFRMDTDDYCMPDRFEKQLLYIHFNPNIVLLGSCIEEFDSTMSRSLGYRNVPCSHNDILKYVNQRNPFNHMTVAFRKDIIELVGGYQHHLYMEDYNLWIRVIAAGYKVANLQDSLVKVRCGDSMVKRRKGITYIKSEFQLAKLKIEKKIDTPLNSYLNFTLRSIPRLLPTSILSKIYKKLRK